jgi:hypothetical protein
MEEVAALEVLCEYVRDRAARVGDFIMVLATLERQLGTTFGPLVMFPRAGRFILPCGSLLCQQRSTSGLRTVCPTFKRMYTKYIYTPGREIHSWTVLPRDISQHLILFSILFSSSSYSLQHLILFIILFSAASPTSASPCFAMPFCSRYRVHLCVYALRGFCPATCRRNIVQCAIW